MKQELTSRKKVANLLQLPQEPDIMGKKIENILIGIIATVVGGIILFYVLRYMGSSSNYPNVTGQYNGTIHNTHLDITRSMSLLIKQDRGSINGYFTVSSGLIGSGPFMGTVDSSGNIQFTVQSNQYSEPFSFSGTVGSNESISGTYCNLTKQNQCDPTGAGTWIVSRGSFSSSINLQAPDTTYKKRQHPEFFRMLPLFDLESLTLLTQVLQT